MIILSQTFNIIRAHVTYYYHHYSMSIIIIINQDVSVSIQTKQQLIKKCVAS